jgi:hypothetical protein
MFCHAEAAILTPLADDQISDFTFRISDVRPTPSDLEQEKGKRRKRKDDRSTLPLFPFSPLLSSDWSQR